MIFDILFIVWLIVFVGTIYFSTVKYDVMIRQYVKCKLKLDSMWRD